MIIKSSLTEALIQELPEALRAESLDEYRFIDCQTLIKSLRQSCFPESSTTKNPAGPLHDSLWGIRSMRGALAVAFPYDTTEESMDASLSDPTVRIAWFARADYYGELVSRLQSVAKRLVKVGGFKKSDIRILVNSGIAEKPLAAASGLAHFGRHGLVINGRWGCSCILGIMLLPFDPVSDNPGHDNQAQFSGSSALHPSCASCNACERACPTKAIRDSGIVDVDRCLQRWASTEGAVPPNIEANWHDSLYGCDLCIRACPFGQSGRVIMLDRGKLPARISAAFMLESSNQALKQRFKGSVLDRSWISPEALRRNTRLSLNIHAHIVPETDAKVIREDV